MKHFLTVLTLLSLSIPVFAESRTIVTRTPVYNYNQPYYNPYNNHSFSDIGALEQYALNRTYPRESSLQRLQRLESQAFGAVQSGDINQRYDNVRSAILSRPKDNYRTSLLRGLGNYFSGQMTGFTPSIGSSSPYAYTSSFNPAYNGGFSTTPYPTTFGNQRYVDYGGTFFNRGYRMNNYGTGSSSGVKILD